MNEYKNILFQVDDRIAIVTLHRPHALNALNKELLQELDDILDEIANNDEIRCVIVTGAGIAKEILFSGVSISAERALAIGLVNHVVEPNRLLDFSRELASRICKQGKNAVRLTKQAIHMGTQLDVDRALDYEANIFAISFSLDEHKEGIQAFIEKRSPNF